ncbi:phosphonate metabolism protein/1,5-bisphosphokinase (PRPP-forming) PhnN [Pseudomonas sp. LS1212]|uniref:phosphonate metabolism protein/1,5-bisphosphokinase (PRPP-forming) PhnN n=1 Tax=Pseudomonas sp. LS1212 TaxID=2972478 RepID=UPI00215C24AF|nr:phosphonate metabolism protein/1,5-bisphosphokinase (PRPP-forming) PhnN [Pseudomonas sp. LS1212]UVJ45370.1 phosphonate metabolism protein/1,5-bisphosphokinase (PRPP-forming) PhnN [Pseudomonas sp. LS1212]
MTGRLIYLTGPSGSGKDSLIEAARAPLQQRNVAIVRRVITRSAEAVGEDALGVSPQQFEQMRQKGDFAMHWKANGLDYGIPAQIDDWLAEGRHVLVNGSRAYLAQAMARYPRLLPILLTVDNSVLRHRLLGRGRESIEDIERRLARNQRFGQEGGAVDEAGMQIRSLDNSGSLSDAVMGLMSLLDAEGVNSVQQRVELDPAALDQRQDK